MMFCTPTKGLLLLRSIAAPFDVSLDDTFIPRRNMNSDALRDGIDKGDTFWIDLIDPTSEEITWLAEVFQLHPAVVQDLRREDRRPNLMVYPDYLFLSLFQPTMATKQISGQEIHCLVGERFFITVRKSAGDAIEEAYNRVAMNADSWRRGVAYFLYLTTQFVVDSYYPLLDRISNQLNKLEDAVLNGQDADVSQRTIYRIKQQLVNLRQMVAPQREVLASVIGEERLASTQTNRDLFRHLYERLLRVYDVIDSQRDLSSNILDLLQSQESKRLADAMHRLTIFSMIFLPLTFFSALFELNFATTADPFTLPVAGQTMLMLVVGLMIFSAVALFTLFRWKRWI